MIPERHPAAVWRPVHAAHYACAKPPPAREAVTIELNTRTKVAIITMNGHAPKTIQLTCRNQLSVAEFYRDKVGYKLEWLGSDVILLTKKGRVTAPQPLMRAA